MTDKYRKDLIQYRLERARQAFEEAKIMQREGHWNTCVNRLYYACYYSVTALLVNMDLAASKHSGVKSLFNKHFVKTGDVSKEYGRLYNQLFEARQEGDYVDFVSFDRDTINPWISSVGDFIETIGSLIENSGNS